MAYALSNNISGLNIPAKLTQFAEAWKTHRAKRAVYNRTFGELASLSDRDLADIGIARSDIRDIAWQEANKAA